MSTDLNNPNIQRNIAVGFAFVILLVVICTVAVTLLGWAWGIGAIVACAAIVAWLGRK